MNRMFEDFAGAIVSANDEHLLNYGPEEQVANAVERLERFAKTTPLTRVMDREVDLAGFGTAPIHFESADDRYLLLSQVAEQLGMPVWTACDWARLQHGYAIEDQRQADEDRGDGKLGYEHLRGFVDLRLSFTVENPEAKPDAGGGRWSAFGDWLISHDRLPSLILVSPWGQEYMDNTLPHFGHVARKMWGDKLASLPGVDADGNPTDVELFSTDGLSEEEALRRARRGPSAVFGDETPDNRDGDPRV